MAVRSIKLKEANVAAAEIKAHELNSANKLPMHVKNVIGEHPHKTGAYVSVMYVSYDVKRWWDASCSVRIYWDEECGKWFAYDKAR